MAHSFNMLLLAANNIARAALLICITLAGFGASQQFLPQTSDGVIYFPGHTSTNANSIHNLAVERNRNMVLAFISQPSRMDLPSAINPFQISIGQQQPLSAPSGPAFTSPSASGGGGGEGVGSIQQHLLVQTTQMVFTRPLSSTGSGFQQPTNSPNVSLLPPNRPPVQQQNPVARPTGQAERPVTTNSAQNAQQEFALNQFTNGGGGGQQQQTPEVTRGGSILSSSGQQNPLSSSQNPQNSQNQNNGQNNFQVRPGQSSFRPTAVAVTQRQPADEYYTESPNAPLNAFVDFAWRLFSVTPSGTSNVVLSPILTQLALAVLQYGAEGYTRRDLAQNVQTSIAAVAELIQSLKSIRSQQTVIEYASTMFVNSNFRLNRTFTAIAEEAKCSVVPVNFRQSPQAVRVINTWVSQATRRAIPAILDQSADTRHVEMLLANAIYFKSAWKFRFNETETNYFYKAKANRKAVTFLKTKQYFRTGYLKAGNSGAYWVEVPYDGEEFSMVFVVPEFRDTLLTLISELTSSHVQTIINQLGSYNRPLVELKVPKFDIESKTSLLGPLRDMGLDRLFAEPSELVYINERQRTPVGECIHNARLAVDETGTVAAAANAFSIIPLSISQPDPETPFIVDQPFIAMIVDTRHNYPLFLAKIFDP